MDKNYWIEKFSSNGMKFIAPWGGKEPELKYYFELLINNDGQVKIYLLREESVIRLQNKMKNNNITHNQDSIIFESNNDLVTMKRIIPIIEESFLPFTDEQKQKIYSRLIRRSSPIEIPKKHERIRSQGCF